MRRAASAAALRCGRRPRSLRSRLTLLLIATAVLIGIGFEALLATLIRRSEFRQLEARATSLTEQLAERAAGRLAMHDRAGLHALLNRTSTGPDVLGAAAYTRDGPTLARRNLDRVLWPELGPISGRPESRRVFLRYRHTTSGVVLDATAPIMSRSDASRAPSGPERPDGLWRGPRHPTYRHVGWVRLAISTQRASQAVAEAAGLGLALVLLILLAGVAFVSFYLRVVLRPLREASDLARAIASGQLDRRLPVRSPDELGDLAVSMNTMATALQAARVHAESESVALRAASAAVLSIAGAARETQDPHGIFAVVARELRAVTHARAVALAVVPARGKRPLFEHFDPPAPWGDLSPGQPVSAELIEQLDDLDGPALRLGESCRVPECAGLSEDGFRAALAVPLLLPGSPPAVLLAASDDPDAFSASECELVTALASHLSSVLRATRLQERLQVAFDELQRTHDYLVRSEMLRVAGEMASGVAHDFNNLLGAILGRTQLLVLQLEAGTLSADELMTSLAVIERAAQDGRETGRRLRQFGHVAQGAAEAVELHTVLRDAVEFTRPRWQNEAQAAGATIHLDVDVRPGVWVAGQASELREVFTNLILNAADALPRGGTIRVAMDADERNARATVADDGVGMDEETRRRLFEPFFTTKGNEGTGLGLAVVYGIVQRHGGSIEVATRPGAGTHMEITLPRAGAPAQTPRPPARLDGLPALDVLVVDDEEPVRNVLGDTAATLGQRVTTCASGEEALRACRPGAFQLVLTDLGMPGMTGWELARRLRTLDPALTIVFVTGWGEDVDGRAALDAGADLVLAKPFDVADVARAIRLAAERLADGAAGLDRAA